jgi:hypothetical protein
MVEISIYQLAAIKRDTIPGRLKVADLFVLEGGFHGAKISKMRLRFR